jgi:hypothetical protein
LALHDAIGDIVKNTKGIQCVVNEYEVSGVALVDGESHPFKYSATKRNARASKAYVADQMGTSSSQVLVNFTLKKHKFSIDCDYEELVNMLKEHGINFTEKTQEEPEK